MKVLNMKNFYYDDYLKISTDTSAAMVEAIRDLEETGGRLIIAPGTYDFYPDCAFEKYYGISNNDKGTKHIAMPLIGLKNIIIEGNGASFIFHGNMMPMVLEKCQNIHIRNLTIDYIHPFYIEGKVQSATENSVVLKIDEDQFPYYIQNEHIYYAGWNNRNCDMRNFLHYSAETGNLVPETADCWVKDHEYTCQCQPGGLVEIRLMERNFPYFFSPGNTVVILYITRENPGIFGTDSGNLFFENVKVHHCEGMGFIFQMCNDVSLTDCHVVPSRNRLISACADATHFVNCSGKITIDKGVFTNQGDDATNVHGIYTRIEKIDGKKLYLNLMHFQQSGVPLYNKGDVLRFVKCDTLQTFGESRVVTTEMMNDDVICVSVDLLPSGLSVGDGVECFSKRTSEVAISNCITGKNRARSFLISCRGKVRIFNNTLISNGAAIWISGDCNHWFESGPTENVEIYNNIIECINSTIGGWGKSAIEIVPELDKKTAGYHNRIHIHHNEFRSVVQPIVHALSVSDLIVSENRLCCSKTIPSEIQAEYCVVDCQKNEIEVN